MLRETIVAGTHDLINIPPGFMATYRTTLTTPFTIFDQGPISRSWSTSLETCNSAVERLCPPGGSHSPGSHTVPTPTYATARGIARAFLWIVDFRFWEQVDHDVDVPPPRRLLLSADILRPNTFLLVIFLAGVAGLVLNIAHCAPPTSLLMPYIVYTLLFLSDLSLQKMHRRRLLKRP